MALIRFLVGTLWYACFARLGKFFFWIAERGRTAESRLAEPLHTGEVEQLSALPKLCASPIGVRKQTAIPPATRTRAARWWRRSAPMDRPARARGASDVGPLGGICTAKAL
jgi:hypothetical protein